MKIGKLDAVVEALAKRTGTTRRQALCDAIVHYGRILDAVERGDKIFFESPGDTREF